MKINHLRPMLNPDTDAGGDVSVPAAGGPDGAPLSQAGAASSATEHPMDARPGSILEDDSVQGDGTVLTKGSDKDSGGNESESEQPPSMFDEGFDPSTLEAPLQGKYSEMQAALSERMSALPDAEVMQTVGMKSNAFDRLVQMPEFQKWAEGMTDSGPSTVGGEAAVAAADENLLEGLDEDVQEGIGNLIQKKVDEAVASRVTPLSDAYYADKADSTISDLKEQYGAETFERLADTMSTHMEAKEGVTIEDAFKLARFDELQAQVAAQKQTTIQSKVQANMEGDGSFSTEPSARPKVRDAKEATRLAFEMVAGQHPDAFDPLSLPPGYRGE